MTDQVESPQSLTTIICCQNFIETLNKVSLVDEDTENPDSCDKSNSICDNNLKPDDILSFMNYCQTWQQK